MRNARPPVGWEHVRNCFPVPNELLELGLPANAVAVYLCLLRHADRRTGQCHPSEQTIARKLHLSRNTVAKQVKLLEERGLIVTERTTVMTKRGERKNGTLLYTVVPAHEVVQEYYQQQLHALDQAAERQRTQARAEQLGIKVDQSNDGQSA